MANSTQKIRKFSDNKLFWMTVLALLLSLTTLALLSSYIYAQNNIAKADAEIYMKYQTEGNQLRFCYDNDIKPCTIETIQEFNKKNNYQ